MPMTVLELADFIGLTETHVHRILRVLQEDEEIERDGRAIRFLDRQSVVERLNYRDLLARPARTAGLS